MTRLSLAIALVVHLSGLSAVAAVVCAQPGMTATSCCCHHEANAQGATHISSVASPTCPCTMTPRPAAPSAPMPAAQVSSNHGVAAILVATPAAVAALRPGRLPAPLLASGDSTPSYLTAAHPRC